MKVLYVAFVICLAIGALVQAQDSPGFISIDCGALNGYTDDNLTIPYLPDDGYVDSGQNMQISSKFNGEVPNQQMLNLRVFPNGTRNCYTLRPNEGKNNKYLIRASFFYGNFDSKSKAGSFDLHIDANFWTTVSPSSYTYEEIVYTASRDYIKVCLVNRGTGVPFISALELRLLDNSTYPTKSAALQLYLRENMGSSTPYIRYPFDDYDRIWQGVTSNSDTFFPITKNTSVDFKRNDNYIVPAEVLETAMQTLDNTYYIYGTFDSNATVEWYAYFHFAEIQEVPSSQVRAFQVFVQGNLLSTVTPDYLKPLTVPTPSPVRGATITYNISSTNDATLAPFTNAKELFYVIDLPNPLTYLGDDNGINHIKDVYKVARVSWQGDPCSPQEFRWNGLICTYDNSPRITSLNLSSSGLTGKIAPSFVNLTALVSMDLSFNQLTGQLPDFIAQMTNLKTLNLSGNNINGPIPNVVNKKISDGSLKIILVDNPICQTEPEFCTDKGPPSNEPPKKISLIPIVIGVVAGIIVLVFVIVTIVLFQKRNKGKQQKIAPNDNSWPPSETNGFSNQYYDLTKSTQSNGSSMAARTLVIGQTTRAYTSSEVLSITENFEVTIGEGGFGNVYLGTLSDGTRVAVKALSPESKQGYKEFHAEAQLLMIVHHKNLVSLLGYCDEFENMALIYELMPQGNVRQHLSGLEYLHNGCRPPIIHRDLKTSNILLDEHMQAKIADFGLSRIFKHDYEESYVSTRPAGTPGYLDPTFNTTGNLNKQSDIYSFGIILLELITGHPAVIRNQKGSTHIVQWVSPLIERGDVQSIVDPRFHGQFDANSVWKVIEIAMMCVQLVSSQRPDINQVLSDLKESLSIESNNQRGAEISYTKSSSLEMASFELNVGPAAR